METRIGANNSASKLLKAPLSVPDDVPEASLTVTEEIRDTGRSKDAIGRMVDGGGLQVEAIPEINENTTENRFGATYAAMSMKEHKARDTAVGDSISKQGEPSSDDLVEPTDLLRELTGFQHTSRRPGAYRLAPGGGLRNASSFDSGESMDSPTFAPEATATDVSSPRLTEHLAEAELVVPAEHDSLVVEAKIIRRKRQVLALLVAIVVVVAIIVGLSVGLTRRVSASAFPTSSPTSSPTLAPTSQLDQDFRPLLSAYTLEQLSNASSAQYLAYEWTTKQDLIAIDGNNLTKQLIRMSRRFALATLYYATGGDRTWSNTANWLHPNATECDWYGCACEDSPDIIDALALPKNELAGSLPEELGLLGTLSTLDLSRNLLSGTVLNALWQLSGLTSLQLNDNALGGRLDSDLARLTRLETLDLSGNVLSGPVPTQVALLSQLTDLSLNDNQMRGSIPTELSALTKLVYLFLSNNALTGTIPTELASLPNLRFLLLDGNWLEGPIPTWMGTMRLLEILTLYSNTLSGSFPSELAQLTELSSFQLQENLMNGTLPSQWNSKLQILSLDTNQFTGPIPAALKNLTNLERLDLSYNAFTGTIPSTFGFLEQALFLNLGMNALTGPLPSELGALPNLRDLLLLNNGELSGPIPTEWGNMEELSDLLVGGNKLTGTLPTELGQLSNLRLVSLAINTFRGTLPSEWGSLTKLEYLNVQVNDLTGSVPLEVCQLVQQQQGGLMLYVECRELICDCGCMCDAPTMR